MGQICPVDISYKGEKIASVGDRISARHIRKIESAKMKTLSYDQESLLGLVTAKDLIDKLTGEVVIPCNSIIDSELLAKIIGIDVKNNTNIILIYLTKKKYLKELIII